MNNSNAPLLLSSPFQYAIKIANNRNEKRLSAITELTSTMSISKMSNGSFLEGDTTNDGEGSASNHHHVGNCDVSERGADVGGEIDPEDDMATVAGGGVAVAEDRLRLVSPAPPPLKIDTGQGRMDRDRDRDWVANKMGHNYGVSALVNSNTNNSLEGSGGGSNSLSGGGGGGKGGSNRPTHNHHQQHHSQPQPITSNLVMNKVNSKDIHGSHVSKERLLFSRR